MLRWAVIFLAIAIVAGILGFTGIAGTATTFAEVLFWIFIVLFVLTFIINLAAASTIFRKKRRGGLR